jgi:hypothetical protein
VDFQVSYRRILAVLAMLALGIAPMSAALAQSPGSTSPTGVTTRAIVPLDVATVTTGGTAVTAVAATHRSGGGFLFNPSTATVNLCINEQGGTASGTTSSGSLTCIAPGVTYQLAPSWLPVSVVTADSAHPFSGEGIQ